MKRITIINYKVGNQKSLEFFFNTIGYETVLTENPKVLKKAELIILPGIGAFPTAMKSLKENNLENIIKQKAKENVPIIGICLGMQLLATKSYEFSETNGLNLIPGKVIKIPKEEFHIGWNTLEKVNSMTKLWYSNEDSFYFNHSYFFEGEEKYINAKSNLKINIPAIISKNNIYGIQFHPEKSQQSGKNLMINLLNELI